MVFLRLFKRINNSISASTTFEISEIKASLLTGIAYPNVSLLSCVFSLIILISVDGFNLHDMDGSLQYAAARPVLEKFFRRPCIRTRSLETSMAINGMLVACMPINYQTDIGSGVLLSF